jgi:hypothetical protein
MKVLKINSHLVTEVINTDGGSELMSFVKDCLDGKNDDLYKGNSSDTAHLQNQLELIVNKIGQYCFDLGYSEGSK